jgi:hypothetical protein
MADIAFPPLVPPAPSGATPSAPTLFLRRALAALTLPRIPLPMGEVLIVGLMLLVAVPGLV